MGSFNVNMEEQLSQVLSVRLSPKELKRLQKTLKNYGLTKGSMSDKMRLLFKEVYLSSVRRSNKQIMTHVILQKENTIVNEDPEEQRAYEEWFSSLGIDY